MRKIAAITLGVALALLGTAALASRNTSGVYTLPAGNPVAGGTVITKTWANQTMGDLANEITASLSRDGNGGMRAPLRVPDGSAPAPTLSFTNETGTGLRRAGAGDLRIGVLGADTLKVTASGADVLRGNVTLPAASSQSVLKSGGSLVLGTSDANDVFLSLGGTNYWQLEAATGNLKKIGPGTGTVQGLPSPTLADQAATKDYVDTLNAALTTTINERTLLAVKTSDQSDSTGGFVSVSDLSFAVEAGKWYEFEAVLSTSTAATTTGIYYSFTGPASPTQMSYVVEWYNSSTVPDAMQVAGTSGTAYNSVTAAAGHPTTRSVQRITGFLLNGANAGTLQLQFRTEVAASAVTLHAGSLIRYRKLN
jgi:hypothetical protein